MKVIILKTNEVRDVAVGYAVNYLLPKGLAAIASSEKLKEMKQQAVKAEKDRLSQEKEARSQGERLEGKVIILQAVVGKNNKIHGSITKKEIAEKLKILKTQVRLAEPIKKLGEYTVELKFGKTKAKIKVKVKEKK